MEKAIKIKDHNPFERIYEFLQDIGDLKAGHQAGKSKGELWMPLNEENDEWRTTAYDAEAAEIALRSGFFKRVK